MGLFAVSCLNEPPAEAHPGKVPELPQRVPHVCCVPCAPRLLCFLVSEEDGASNWRAEASRGSCSAAAFHTWVPERVSHHALCTSRPAAPLCRLLPVWGSSLSFTPLLGGGRGRRILEQGPRFIIQGQCPDWLFVQPLCSVPAPATPVPHPQLLCFPMLLISPHQDQMLSRWLAPRVSLHPHLAAVPRW